MIEMFLRIFVSTTVIVFAAVTSIGVWLYSYADELVAKNISRLNAPKIAVVSLGGVYDQAFLGLKESLGRKGYREDRNIIYLVRNVNGKEDEIGAAVTELLRRRPDMFYTISTPVTDAVWKTAGNDIPIVFNIVGDPIGAGFAESYSSSATNLTGCSNLSAELSGKRLEIFKEAFPEIDRVATFYNPSNAFSQISIAVLRHTAQNLGVDVAEFETGNAEELGVKVSELKSGEYDGIYVTPDAMVVSKIELIIDKANELKIPTMGHEETLAERGVTLTYGANFYKLGMQCANSVESILSGQRPQDIPIRTPDKLDTVVNSQNLDQLGLSISGEVLNRADRIIE